MDFDYSAKVKALQARVHAFVEEHVYPNEETYYEQIAEERWCPVPVIEELKPKARAPNRCKFISCRRPSFS